VKGAASELSQSDSASLGDLAGLIADVHRGDERALAALYDATVGKLYGLASAILRSTDDAEDVVCETYAYVWANAARYDDSRGNVLAWLLMLCRSRALDRLRRRRAHTATLDQMQLTHVSSPAQEPEDVLSVVQQHTTMYAALAMLTPERRRLISLAFLHGLSHQEIAERTGLPLGTVKSHVRRALAQLREALGDE
jgi:RNA polymerase sigma-70 factor (ECF subfamily)